MVKNISETQLWALFVARLLLIGLFVGSVFGKITGFTSQAQFIGSIYSIGSISFLPEIMLVVAIILELIGVVSLALGYKIRIGAIALIIFTIAATLMVHIGEGELNAFLKNLGIIGGLIALMLHSTPGKFALDNKN